MTPTTTQVMGKERIPAHFRPSNQARMVAAQPLNQAPSQSMMPGLGNARSGNAVTDNGLASGKSATVHNQVVAQDRVTKAKQVTKAMAKANDIAVALTADIDAIKAKGDKANNAVVTQKKVQLQKVKNDIKQMDKARKCILHGESHVASAPMVAPWEQNAMIRSNHRWLAKQGHQYQAVPQAQALPFVNAPATPDPLQYEPAGISYQKGQSKIAQMQANIQEVKPISSMDGLAGWLDESTIPGVPNKVLAITGGALAGFLLLTKFRRRRAA